MRRVHLIVLILAGFAANAQANTHDDDDDHDWEIIENDLGLRRDPDKDSDYVVRGLHKGDRVEKLDCEKHNGHDWCRVEYQGEIGWIGEDRLRPASDDDADDDSYGDDEWEIADDDMGLRGKPDKDAEYVVRGLRKGDRVDMLECEEHHGNEWCRVEFHGNIGWIGKDRLRRD